MARIKGGMNAKKKHNRVLKLAKGYRGARSKQYRVAKQSVMRALTESYKGRKQKKRQFRQCCCKNEWFIIQQVHVWFKACKHRLKQKGIVRNGNQRCRRFCKACRTCKV